MSPPPALVVDAAALKALAHPLRVRVLDALEARGRATASILAAALGESSGATSYHLRQLHKAGFVEEVENVGTGRERWWRPRTGGWTLPVPDLAENAGDRALVDSILTSMIRQSEQRTAQFFADFRRWPSDWQHQAQRLEWHMELNTAQVAELNGELMAVFEKYKAMPPGPEARRVEVGAVTFPAGPPPEPPVSHW